MWPLVNAEMCTRIIRSFACLFRIISPNFFIAYLSVVFLTTAQTNLHVGKRAAYLPRYKAFIAGTLTEARVGPIPVSFEFGNTYIPSIRHASDKKLKQNWR